MTTRRHILQSLLTASLAGQRLLASHDSFRRNYRADAVILFFSLPIYTREDVGGGFLASSGRSEKSTQFESLRFAAASDPARTRGLNRLGFLEETLRVEDGRIAQSSYRGFMTSSGEEDF